MTKNTKKNTKAMHVYFYVQFLSTAFKMTIQSDVFTFCQQLTN